MNIISKAELMKQLGNFVSVQNTEARNGYNQASNQFEIRFENGTAFQSYRTLIAVRMKGQLYLSDSHDYSRTTSSHCTRWTGYTTQERRKGLNTGEFTLISD